MRRALECNPNKGKGSAKGFQEAVREASKAAPKDLGAEIVTVLQIFQPNTCGPAKARIFGILHPDKPLPRYLCRSSKVAPRAKEPPAEGQAPTPGAGAPGAPAPGAAEGAPAREAAGPAEPRPPAPTLAKWFKQRAE